MNLIFIDYLPLEMGLKTPLVLSYYSTRMILAAITSLMISIFLGPPFIRMLQRLKMGQPIRTEHCALLGSLHAPKQDTPTMGGALILFSMLISLFLWMDWSHTFTLIMLVVTLLFGILGGVDDWLKLKYRNSKGLSLKTKLFWQILFSLALAFYFFYPLEFSASSLKSHFFSHPIIKEHHMVKNENEGEGEKQEASQISFREFNSRLYVPFFKEPIDAFQGAFVLLGILWVISTVTGASDAVNLTDGLDGLAAGCLIMVATALAIMAFFSNNVAIASYLHIPYIEGSGEIAIYLSAFVGACLGFLWYNCHPAEMFMGDIGSLTLGAIIGVSALLLKKEAYLVIIGGVFVLEALSVILQVASYKIRKKRIFLIAPLHHHFEYKGWKETKVVIRFWIASLLFSIIGVLLLKFNS